MSLVDDELEMDYYLKILDVYQNKKFDKEDLEIWKNKSYIELMQVLKRTNNRNLVKNAIILILSLFEDMPLDLYDSYGMSAKKLKKEERKSYLDDLKLEFIPN